ncbi:MAG: DNA polymerase III subunit gamma/tau [Bacteroidetes bacterium]|nr:DNA polymerase III subunit gamma/tau [Bacteroidota bacterium]MBU1720507.1 DNA polymerase III subunit gamma/tau [Bacteroidota bacterium]
MENFIVSARKYRPGNFNSVVGQDHVSVTLKNAISKNHLAQAFLFCGPRGVGKTTCARILAKTINCANPTSDTEPCNACESCISFNESRSFNIHELDAASNNSVDDIRSLVDQVRFAPQTGKYSVYIIDEVHMLSQAAFNAFLKTLEEPPAYAKFILATTEKHKILPTILSRCQIFDFRRITVEDIALHLKYVADQEKITADPDALHIIALKADGALRDALSIFDQIVSFTGNELTYDAVIQNLNVLDYEYYFKITNLILAGDIPGVLTILDEIFFLGYDAQNFLLGLGSHYRDLLVCKDKSTFKLLEVGENIKGRYIEQSGKTGLMFLVQSLELIAKADVQYNASRNKRLLIELTLMQLCSLDTTAQPALDPPIRQVEKPAENQSLHQPQKPQPVAMPVQYMEPDKKKEDEKPMIVPGTGIKRSVSLKKTKEPLNQENDNPEPKKTAISLSKPFDESSFIDAWKKFADQLSTDSPSFSATLHNHLPQFNENKEITVRLNNKAQMAEFAEKKQELLDFLRKKLSNTSIVINQELNEDNGERILTNREKMMKMSAENENLNEFISQLGLEFDY